MPLTEQEVAILAAKRVNFDPSQTLKLQTLVPAALANLAKNYAKDPNKRHNLMTDPTTTRVLLTRGPAAPSATAATSGYADLSTLFNTNNIMLDTLKYGTIFLEYRVPFTSGDVGIGTWPTGGYAETLTSYGISTGLAVRLETDGALPGGLFVNLQYYLITNVPQFAFANTAADAAAGTGITLTNVGTGNHTVISTDAVILQWVGDPTQGNLTLCLPTPNLVGWLQGSTIHVRGYRVDQSNTYLTFNVPFVPTLATLPADADIEADLIDEMVSLIVTGDPAPSQNPDTSG